LPEPGKSVAKTPKYSGKNRLLARLSRQDFELLKPHLVELQLPLRKSLEIRNRRITAAYFPENGVASVVANGKVGMGVEVGLIGREGMSGIAIIMGADRAHHDTFMQIAGNGLCLKAVELKRCVGQSETLQRELLRYAHAFGLQVANTAMINAKSKIEERLARWLLVAHDRLDGDDIPLTHEFLATMLGVRRPGVTIALHLLESDGLIQRKRASVVIVDRKGLEQRSNGAYGLAEAAFRRLG
jgi:CRP-like cAMP-binding protein